MHEVQSAEWRSKIAVLTQGLAPLPQQECPLKHFFAPGVYIREIFMPADTVVIGKIHKTEHFNIIQRGRVLLIDHKLERHELGPSTFVSAPGVQKVLYIQEDTVWSTVHLTQNRDLASLETELIEPHDSYPLFDRLREQLAIAQAAERLIA